MTLDYSAGTDLLSTSEGLAMLEDRSWITIKLVITVLQIVMKDL